MNEVRAGVTRHSYAMTIAYEVGSVVSILGAVVALLFEVTLVGVCLAILFVFCGWQEHRWRASTGHESFGFSFAADAAQELHAPKWILSGLVVVGFLTLVIVVPGLAIVGIVT